MKYHLIVVLFIFMFISSASLFATTIYVDDDAPNDPGPGDPAVSDPLEDGTESHPYDAIQEALDAAVSGVDSIIVKDGTYTDLGNGDLDFNGKALTLKSENGADTTIIDCIGGEVDRGFNFHSGEGLDSVVDGFTIRHGVADMSMSNGGGIYCNSSSPTITNCKIENNYAFRTGAGICCGSSSAMITNCTISGNSGDDFFISMGAGISAHDSNITIRDCTITDNIVSLQGGGIGCIGGANIIENCVISGNMIQGDQSGYGGGVYCEDGSVVIRNCMITNNSTIGEYFNDSDGGGIALRGTNAIINNCTIVLNSAEGNGGGVYDEGGSTLTNCILWDNSPNQVDGWPTLNYCNIEDGWSGSGSNNIDQSPRFVGGGDYHILSNSPCINKGDPSLDYEGQKDIDGEKRVLNDRVDIGADELYVTRVLNLSTPGNGKVRINDGDVQTMPVSEILGLNEVVKVEAVPDESYVFSHWSDHYNGICNPASITMNFDKDVIVNFKVEGMNYIYVNDATGDNSYDGLAREWDGAHGPKKTIQAGIDATVDGPCYTVLVADGIYRGEGNRDIEFYDKGTTLKSENGHTTTTIDCEGTESENHRGFSFFSGDEADTVVDGFTIQNGYDSGGGGIFCIGSPCPTIMNCRITSNIADSDGGGIACLAASCPTIINCIISDNSVGRDGGGIKCDHGSLRIINCLITGNSADDGAGIQDRGSLSLISNCTIAYNNASNAGGGLFKSDYSNLLITDCVLWGNTPDQIYEEYYSSLFKYCDIQGGWFGVGNIDADPLFVSGPEHDYYLSQTASGQPKNSPCVDTGSDSASSLGFNLMSTRTDRRVDTGIVDMGYHDPYALCIYSITQDGGDTTIHWNAKDGVSYVVEYSVDLSIWHGISVGQVSEWTHVGGASCPQIYYRLREQ